MNVENIWQAIPAALPDELVTILHQAAGLRIERIVTWGQASPPGYWYDQDDEEWVLVLEGSAAVEFEGEAKPVELQRGTYVNIPAHRRHRVAWTHPTERTVWLAVHQHVERAAGGA